MKKRAFGCLVFVTLPALFSACSSDPDPVQVNPDSITYELLAQTLVLSDADLRQLESDSNGTMVFNSKLAEATRGKVLLGGVSSKSKAGFLRMVASRKEIGEKVELRTFDVPPQLAFKKLVLKSSRNTQSLSLPAQVPNASVLRPLDESHFDSGDLAATAILYDGDDNESTTDDQVRATVQARGSYDYALGIDFDWGALDTVGKASDCALSLFDGGSCDLGSLLPEFKAGGMLKLKALTQGTLEGGAYLSYDKEWELVPDQLVATVVIPPVVISFHVSLKGRVEGAASSHFKVGARVDATFGAAYQYSSKTGLKEEPPSFEKSFTVTDKDYQLHAEGKVAIGPRIKAKLFGALGPSAGLDGFARVVADPNVTPCVSLLGGVDGSLGLEFGIPGTSFKFLDKSWTKTLFQETVASYSCEIPAEVPKAPGEGPLVSAITNPKFTPWAKVVSAGGQGSVSGPDRTWTDIVRTIDGRYAVTGNPHGDLAKVSEDGTPIWARRYNEKGETDALAIRRTAPTTDGAMFALHGKRGLLKVGQSGGVAWGTRYVVPSTSLSTDLYGSGENTFGLSQLAVDGNGGAYLFGSRAPSTAVGPTAWRLHVDRDGAIVDSREYTLDGRGLYPQAALKVGDDTVVALLSNGADYTTRATVLARVAADGSVKWATRISGCTGAPDLGTFIATAVRQLSDGTFALVGGTGTIPRAGFFRAKSDGSVTTGAVTKSTGLSTEFLFTDLVELPTGSFVAVGDYTYGYDGTRLTLAGLDLAGRVQWLRAYGLVANSKQNGQVGAVSGVLTDDGGVFVLGGLSGTTQNVADASWFGLKVAAKDGLVTLNSSVAQQVEQPYEAVVCTPATAPVTLTQSALSATREVLTVESKKLTVSATKLN